VIAIGVQTWSTDVRALARYWRAADALGYARITYGDGLFGFTHDGFTLLGALAVLTGRARIGPAVTYAFDRAAHHPAWLAKRAVAVDHLSGGRLDLRLGVGAAGAATAAAWTSHGIAYPPARTRLARLEAAIGIVRALWRGEAVDHDGAFGPLRGARLAPAPVQRPGPPVWVSAMGPAALALAARLADGWEASYVGPEAFAARCQALDALLERHGRAPGDVRRSVEVDVVLGRTARAAGAALARFRAARGIPPDHPLLGSALAGSPAAVVERVAAYAKAGATDLMLGFADFPETAMLETFAARVLPWV